MNDVNVFILKRCGLTAAKWQCRGAKATHVQDACTQEGGRGRRVERQACVKGGGGGLCWGVGIWRKPHVQLVRAEAVCASEWLPSVMAGRFCRNGVGKCNARSGCAGGWLLLITAGYHVPSTGEYFRFNQWEHERN